MPLAELYEHLSGYVEDGLIKDYEFEDAIHAYLHRSFGELFTKEVQLGGVPE